MKTFLIIPMCCLLFASCSKKDNSDISDDPDLTATTFSGTLHDTGFTADSFQCYKYPGSMIVLYAYETNSTRFITLTLDNKNFGTHTMTHDTHGSGASCRDGGGVDYFSIYGGGHGTITVSSSTSFHVSGTFSFVGYNGIGVDSAIVSGQFNNFNL